MKYLAIIRHAKSSWEDSELPDVIRPLNERGKTASQLVGKQLALLHEKPDLIISSPATRAYHTALNIARLIGYRLKSIDVRPTVYYEGEQGVLNMLRKLDNRYQSVFVVGHEPTCSEIISTLTPARFTKFPTGSVYKMALDIDDWEDIYEAKGKKMYFITPKDIKTH